jgi:hypothetical protein
MADKNSVYTLIEDCAAEKIGDYGRQGTPTTLPKGTRFTVVDSARGIPGHGIKAKYYTIRYGSDLFWVEAAALDAKLASQGE